MANTPRDRLSEPEARILALRIAASYPTHEASISQIKDAVPKYIPLTAEDLKPSVTRPQEEMWQQIVGNVISHQSRPTSIFTEGYAVRLDDGIRVTDILDPTDSHPRSPKLFSYRYVMRGQRLINTMIPILLLCITCSARAEVVDVKYRGPLDLAPFACTDVTRTSFISRVCFDKAKSYMVISLKLPLLQYPTDHGGRIAECRLHGTPFQPHT